MVELEHKSLNEDVNKLRKMFLEKYESKGGSGKKETENRTKNKSPPMALNSDEKIQWEMKAYELGWPIVVVYKVE